MVYQTHRYHSTLPVWRVLYLITFTILTTHPAKFIIPQRDHRVTVGNEMHANGLFHNNRFQAGGNTSFNEYSLIFSQSTVPSANGPLGKALKIAEQHQEIAAEIERSAGQEALRRESHPAPRDSSCAARFTSKVLLPVCTRAKQ